MNKEKTTKLWDFFLEKIEPDFKETMGYGKEEIEKIGIQTFFEKMGWSEEEHLESYKTDRLHIIPCVECHQHFAVYEEDLGLCEECQELYDINAVFSLYQEMAEREGAPSAMQVFSAFYASPEFRAEFSTNISDDTIEYALVRKHPQDNSEAGWKTLPMSELVSWMSKHPEGQYKLIRHDGNEHKNKAGISIFDARTLYTV